MVEYGDYIAERDTLIEDLKDVLDEKEFIIDKYTKIIGSSSGLITKEIYNQKKNRIEKKTGIDLNFAIKGKNKFHDSNIECMIELEEKGLLKKEKELREKISMLNIKIKKLEKPLSKVSSIEKKIYKKMLEGNTVTHSVEMVTEELSMERDKRKRKDIRTVWRHYNKLRDRLKKDGILQENEIKL